MSDRVPFVALERQHATIQEELRAAFDRVLGSSGFILGAEVAAFEDEFAAYCGAEHCVGVASGTAALTLALQAAGIGPGDEVIVPGHTFIASALGVLHAGATPVFCDVEEGTGLIDVSTAGDALGERTAAVMAVHLYGQLADMDAVGRFADRHGLAVFEDAAQAHGATWKGRRAGSLGAAAAFSFYPSKNLGALGDGGAICTADPTLAAKARALRHLGQPRKGAHELTGWNERLDGLQAALLRAKLPHLDSWNQARRELAARYDAELPEPLRTLPERPESPCVYHLYPVRTPDRDGLAARLDEAGVDTGVHYDPACHRQPPFDRGGPDRCPVSTAWGQEELSLPMFEGMSGAELERVAAACHEALRARAA
ncbi:MAG TPA: DegT/DnrJ/EryC1/StrS family aminotransferase [Thermoleophilaceae bacterium]|jgi:dTDP-4-amino-4,6-dideoxygalactose transaminase